VSCIDPSKKTKEFRNSPPTSNLYTGLPALLSEELIETLVDSQSVRIERIISTGHVSPAGFWYDQRESEWVTVLQGEAVLEFENEKRHLVSGDYILIPPHCKHRILSTSMKEPTVWLAVFFEQEKKAAKSTVDKTP